MKTIEGAFSSATLNSSRTNRGPSPSYFWISSDPTILRKVAFVSAATALASKVLPVPGGPYRITPFGGLIPMSSYNSGWVSGSSTASLISCISFSSPPMSLYFSSGALSTFILLTAGSESFSKIPTMALLRRPHNTDTPGNNLSLSTMDKIGTYVSGP